LNKNKNKQCLGCGAELPAPFLDLGETPLANAYLSPDCGSESEPVYPLAVTYCSGCHLVQLTDLVDPEHLFGHYLYFSSYSQSYLEHAREMAQSLTDRFQLGPSSRVVEIASNDGYLLQYFQQRGIQVLGVEPAKNIAEHAIARGIPTVNCFFNSQSAPEIADRFGSADVIIGNNVFAHVPTTNDFLAGVAAALRPGGIAVFEFPYLGDLLEHTEFDTIYHEHVFYFSLSAVKNLAERAGLVAIDVVHQDVHGGSLRLFLQRPGAEPSVPSAQLLDLLAQEVSNGLTTPERYQRFSESVATLRSELLALLRDLKAGGASIAAYGAPAKGNTLLNYCGVGTDLISFTVDRSPHKQGLLLPGSRIPIRAPEALVEEMPAYTVILPWNIAPEIMAQQQDYQARGGRFIIPVPRPKVTEPIMAAVV
jgi:SAM-dependent methyltransferase